MGLIGWILAFGLFFLGLGLSWIDNDHRWSRLSVGGIALLAWAPTMLDLPSPPFTAGGELGWGLIMSCGLWLISLSSSRWLGEPARLLPFLAPILALALAPNPNSALLGVMIGAALVWSCLPNERVAGVAMGQMAFTAAMGLSSGGGLLSQPTLILLGGVLGLGLAILTGVQGQILGMVYVGAGLLGAAGASQILGNAQPLWPLVLVVAVAVSLVYGLRQALILPQVLLIWIGTFAVIFALGRGLGTALAGLMICFWLIQEEDQEPAFTLGAALLSAIGLFRFFVETYPLRAPRADLYTHYSLVGFLLAVTLLVVLTQQEEEPRIADQVLLGFWAVVLPLALGAIWGVRATAGWLGGSLASLLLLSLFPQQKRLLPLVFCGITAAIPLTALVDPVADGPRLERIIVLGGIGILALLSLGLTLIFRRVQGQPVAR